MHPPIGHREQENVRCGGGRGCQIDTSDFAGGQRRYWATHFQCLPSRSVQFSAVFSWISQFVVIYVKVNPTCTVLFCWAWNLAIVEFMCSFRQNIDPVIRTCSTDHVIDVLQGSWLQSGIVVHRSTRFCSFHNHCQKTRCWLWLQSTAQQAQGCLSICRKL